MDEERQLSLFRSPRSRPPVDEPAAGNTGPARLELGDPESIAWACAQEAELARREELRQHEEERARRSAGQRRRAERERAAYPPEEVVVAALREEVWNEDWGIPPRRRRLAERALEELRRDYPSVPLELVQDVFSRAVDSGRLRRSARQWSWEPPEGGGQRRARSAITRAILEHTVLLRAEGVALGLGTLFTRDDGNVVIVSTQGVRDELRAMDMPVEIVAKRGVLFQVEQELLEAEVLGARLPGTESALGPDLAILRVPRLVAGELLAAGKRAYREPQAVLAEGRVRALAGSPVVAQPKLLTVVLLRRFQETLEGATLDYLDFERQVSGPWLPGAGVWTAILDGAGAWRGVLELEGVAYRDDDGRIRAHGLQTLARLLAAGAPDLNGRVP